MAWEQGRPDFSARAVAGELQGQHAKENTDSLLVELAC